MLALRDLPKRENLEKLKQEFPELDILRMETYLALLHTASAVVRKIDSYLLLHGLQQNRFMLLVVLYRDPASPLPANTLAAAIGVRPPTLTGLLTGLLRKKLIRRHHDPADRRMLKISITLAGQEFLRAILPGYYAIVNETFRGLGQSNAAALRALLGKIST